MIPTVIYVVAAIRRAFNKIGRGLSMLADVYAETQGMRRAAHRKYRHIEE